MLIDLVYKNCTILFTKKFKKSSNNYDAHDIGISLFRLLNNLENEMEAFPWKISECHVHCLLLKVGDGGNITVY